MPSDHAWHIVPVAQHASERGIDLQPSACDLAAASIALVIFGLVDLFMAYVLLMASNLTWSGHCRPNRVPDMV